ncbi:hypothetical protein GLOTRDRAFT_93227 [Gloeophyllum trabeum ATCC 11539]|uniref:Uncharacterized protein n=1 Tax=Gloeophyllum trabeum (strain ATCC 11539 / FP-39264 / Madison 617) TaxID=670483 RepID=S7RMG9_GLOTA|nr:uncharacterized protein GLOTRDRAFT_93227 [Gloeophyllum trabeum ATCC 11539]EPQ55630.1 hypothetical protein GLOTRDRAFT_93227 [Gloeophyllum trabeum ATCC 11539]
MAVRVMLTEMVTMQGERHMPNERLHSDRVPARYSMGGTRTATTTYGASATFSFNGTGVTLFSAKRPNHGFFNISLDGTFISTNNGSSGALEGIWGPLYSSGPLDDGLHTVVVIGFNTSVTTDTQLVQDTHPSFSYQGSNWSDTVANASQYNGTNGHITCAKGDSVTYTFQGKVEYQRLRWKSDARLVGDSVQIYGALGPEMGSYMVSLDGVVSALYDAEQAEFYANTMLYAASALPSSRHDVTLTNVGDSLNTSCLSIDYAIAGLAEGVSSTSESATDSPANTETGSPSAAPDSVTHTPSTPAIVGACVGAAIFAGSTFAALWFFFRRRRASRKTAMVADNPPEFTFRPTWSSPSSLQTLITGAP